MTAWAAFPRGRTASAQRIRLIRGYRNVSAAFVKNQRREYARRIADDISQAVRLRGNGAPGNITNAGTRREIAEFVLNAPLSSAIPR
jgi:hypothetical protein